MNININLHMVAMWATVCLLAIFTTPIYRNPELLMYTIMVAFLVTMGKK